MLEKNGYITLNETHASVMMKRSLPSNFCSAPFTKLYISNSNDIFLCQFSNDLLGNLNDNPLEIFSNQKIVDYRNSFLSGQINLCSNQLKCLNCNLKQDDSLARITPSIQSEKYFVTELIIDFNNNSKQLSKWVLSLLPHLKIVKIKFINEIDFDFLEFLNSHSLRLQITLDSQMINLFNNQPQGISFDLINIKISAEEENLISDQYHENIKFILSFDTSNFKKLPELFNLLKTKCDQVEIDFIESFKKINDIDVLKILTYFIGLNSKFDSFLYYIYEELNFFWNRNANNIEIKKMSKILQLKSIDVRNQRRNICPLPFSQVAIYADGSYRPCCWIGDYDLRDNETKNEINKVWNGKKIRALRNEFITGDVKTCSDKIKEVSCIPTNKWKFDQVQFTEIQKKSIFKFHWSFNGACNLECQMCSNWKQFEEFGESDFYFQDLKKNVLPYVGEMELVGGEPFYQKRTFALIDFMKSNNNNCVWNITSNGQFNFNERIKDAITDLRIGLFSISIDSLKENIFAEIRQKGELKKTLIFLDELKTFNRNLPIGFKFDININFVIQKLNWMETEDLIIFADKIDTGLYISPMNDALQFSIYDLPIDERRECHKYLIDLYYKYHHQNLLVLIDSLKKLI